MASYTVFSLEVGLQKILSLLEADDADVRIHAVKVVANLAAEGFLLQPSMYTYILNTITYSDHLPSLYLWIVYLYVKKTEANQQQIVEAGGLTSLLMLLRSTEDETIHRVAAGAIANLAMNGKKMFFFSWPNSFIFIILFI